MLEWPAPRVRVGRPVLVLLTVLLVWAMSGGCGGVLSPDLFVVTRTGSTPGAGLTMLVNEEGVVRCSRDPARPGSPRHLSDPQIIEARTIQEDLHDPASRHISLAPAPGSVLAYYVRDQDGSVRFADNSHGQASVMRKLAQFVLIVAQGICGIPQSGA
jgi:hypothetical protein